MARRERERKKDKPDGRTDARLRDAAKATTLRSRLVMVVRGAPLEGGGRGQDGAAGPDRALASRTESKCHGPEVYPPIGKRIVFSSSKDSVALDICPSKSRENTQTKKDPKKTCTRRKNNTRKAHPHRPHPEKPGEKGAMTKR